MGLVGGKRERERQRDRETERQRETERRDSFYPCVISCHLWIFRAMSDTDDLI
jgi:hypothetical protein